MDGVKRLHAQSFDATVMAPIVSAHCRMLLCVRLRQTVVSVEEFHHKLR